MQMNSWKVRRRHQRQKEKKPRLSKPNLSDDKAQALSDHKKSMGQEVVHKLCLPAAPSQFDVPSVSLFTLIEYAVQNTLREITILSELLPKKKDDNKSARVRHLVQFASELHALFSKLLAVVKWLQTSGEVEKLSSINHFLKQQSASIVEAADKLVAIDIRELHFARLPVFSVDALAAGHIKEDLDVRRKQEDSFEKLNNIIELQSALSAQPIASRFDTIVVKDGMVILRVSGEFEISITVAKKDNPDTKTLWILSDVNILVSNNEIGEGQGLMHSFQMQILYRLVKERMETSQKPLMDAYFCFTRSVFVYNWMFYLLKSLKCPKTCSAYVQVEDYSPADCRLVIGYWLEASEHKRATSKHQIIIFEDRKGFNGGLKTYHQSFDNSLPVMQDEDRSFPSRFIAKTILFRCQEKLIRIQESLSQLVPRVVVKQVGHLLKSLSCQLSAVEVCHPNELINVSIHFYSGDVLCELPALGDEKKEINELGSVLGSEQLSLEVVAIAINQIRNRLLSYC